MIQYLVFAGDYYYPCGGWNDYKSSFESIEEALAAITTLNVDWWHIVDSTDFCIVEQGHRR